MGMRIGRLVGAIAAATTIAMSALPASAGAILLAPQGCPGSGFPYTSYFTLPVAPQGYRDDCTYQLSTAAIDARTGSPTIALAVADGVSVDSHGHLVKLAPPEGETYTVSQPLGVLATLADPSAHYTVSYDSSGRVIRIQGISGATTVLDTQVSYDAAGHIVNIDYGTRDESYTYDAAGHITRWTDTGGETASLSYDSAGHLTTASLTVTGSDPTDSYSYDAAGNVLSWTRSSLGPSLTLTYNHDALGNVTSVVFGPTTDATLTYNAAHKPLAVMHGASSVATFTYDSGGRLTEVQGPSITRAFAYNGLGQLVTTATGSQRTMFAYDAVGRLVSLDNPTGTTISLAYLPGPVATTGAAKSLTHTTVTLTGTVNPAGAPTSYDFVFGTTRKYGRTTAAAAAGSGSPITVSTSLTHLKPGTTYHYALVASNRNGTSTGSDHTFRTPSFSCHVPSLIGDTLRQARKALADHHCRLGHVSRPRHTKRRAHLTVSSQHPRAGAVKPAGTRVAVKLSAA